MITGLLLICILSTKDCTVNSSKDFYEEMSRCEQRLEEIKKEVNESDGLDFFVADTACYNWDQVKTKT